MQPFPVVVVYPVSNQANMTGYVTMKDAPKPQLQYCQFDATDFDSYKAFALLGTAWFEDSGLPGSPSTQQPNPDARLSY
jgi:hypothetical protein